MNSDTSIYVTHDQVEAMTLADRIVIMNGGVAEQVGAPKEIYNYPASSFVAGFIGSPQANLLRGSLGDAGSIFSDTGGAQLRFPQGSLPRLRDSDVILGIRPEDVEIGWGGLRQRQSGSRHRAI